MKAVILIISLLQVSVANASSVENFLPSIRDRVKNCSVLPYHLKYNTQVVEHALRSHCPEVKVLPTENRHPKAKINVAGHQFMATLIETELSDGDYFDVEIRDVASNEAYRIDNVPAYGDVLLGVLEGRTQGIETTLVDGN